MISEMERALHAKWLPISGLILGTVILTNTIPTSFAFDRPVHSSTAILAGAGGAVLALSRWLPKDQEERGRKYERLPLTEVGRSRERSPKQQEDVTYASSPRKLRILFLVLVGLLCLRVELLRRVVDNVQCASKNWISWIPLVFAVWEFWTTTGSRQSIPIQHEDQDEVSRLDKLAALSYALILATFLLATGGYVALNVVSGPASTYICANTLMYGASVPFVQHFASLLDVGILYTIDELLTSKEAKKALSTTNRFAVVGGTLLVSAGFWLVVGGVYWFVQETGRKWLLTIPQYYFWSVMKLNVYIAFTLVCALLTVHHVGILSTSLLATFTSIITSTTAAAWTYGHPFPPMRMGLAFCGILLLLTGFWFYLRVEASAQHSHANASERLLHKMPAWLYVVLTAFMFLWLGLWLSYHKEVSFHPIDMLMYEAEAHHEAFVAQAASSKTLAEASQEYRSRYKRHPPPGFEHWYEFATSRNSSIIDDYDSIYRDLLPFHALSPAEIRERTWLLISNPWNDVAGISIRSGQVAIKPGTPGTHMWMLEGAVSMISKFADKLPDMDLAFNLNDECRVTVPYEVIEPMRLKGRQTHLPNQADKVWPSGRSEQWKPIPEQPLDHTPLGEASWEPVFHRYGNNGCPSNSAARTQRTWNTGSLCRSCASPHSMGGFLANWTLAGDICHQPDLADLHGLYLAPAAFKATPHLYPVFSQSKAGGFNDILYPSPWNYQDKAKYEPNDEHPDRSFAEKESVLFWRGATSEGFSHDRWPGQWRGMARQRFVHMANNVNSTTSDQHLLIKSSSQGDQPRYRYESFSTHSLSTQLSTDIHFVDAILRCGGRDCDDQNREFAPLATPLDFQQHWQYKYLLDLDGAGFSGRFLPFLQSNSLPFKAALFREWWDDRVEAWVHFVPLDLRGHGLYATLAYFTGLLMEGKGGKVVVESHEREAERIARQGREWAEQVLRKEDMEIYMFRLLLEWGRLTDDNREELGYREP